MNKYQYIPLTDDDIRRIIERVDRATPGPWKSYIESRDEMVGPSFIMTEGEDLYLTGATDDDQDFIAAAREDVPRLVAEVLRLRKNGES
jgi:hypothetical protein